MIDLVLCLTYGLQSYQISKLASELILESNNKAKYDFI